MRSELGSLLAASGVTLGAVFTGGVGSQAPTAPGAGAGNQPPQCVAAGPGTVTCTSGTVTFVLDGSGSSDPENDPLEFLWTTGCPGTVIADPTAEVTTAMVDSSLVCGTTCPIRLRVDDGTRISTCRTIVEFEERELSFDAAPGSCPNVILIEEESSGDDLPFAVATLPTSLAGSKTFDPMSAEHATIRLSRAGDTMLDGASVAPISIQIVDVGAPFAGSGDPCECEVSGPDGVPDLLVEFDLPEVIEVLALDEEPDGAVVPLRISGQLVDGTLAFGLDCVLIEHVDAPPCPGGDGVEPLVLSSEVLFSQLDGSSVDLDGATDGSVEIDGGLVINAAGGILVDVPRARISVRGPVVMEFAGHIDTAEGTSFEDGPEICLQSCSTITMREYSRIRARGSTGGGSIALCADEEIHLDGIAGLDARPTRPTTAGSRGGSIELVSPGRVRVTSLFSYLTVQAEQAGEIVVTTCGAEQDALRFEGRLLAAGLGAAGVGGEIRLESRAGGMWLPTNEISATGALGDGTVEVLAATLVEPAHAPLSDPPADVSEGAPSPEPCTCACDD